MQGTPMGASAERYKHAIKYASDLVKTKISKGQYPYHDISHTLDVYRHSIEYGKKEDLSKKEIMLLGVAAAFHDTGYIYKYDKNERMGAEIATKFLEKNGFPKKEISLVSKLILATAVPQGPRTLMQKIICDSDLDSLGRRDFFARGSLLRKELWIVKQLSYTDEEWYTIQLNFISKHKYFTSSAKKLRNYGQKTNIKRLKKMMQTKRSAYPNSHISKR